MVYTQARLEHALQVFRESEPYRSHRGLSSSNLERHLCSKYEFRRFDTTAKAKPIPIWSIRDGSHDSDDDYAPASASKKKTITSARRAKLQKRKADDSLIQENRKKRSKLEKQKCGLAAFVTLKLSPKDGRLSSDRSAKEQASASNIMTKEDIKKCKSNIFEDTENAISDSSEMEINWTGSCANTRCSKTVEEGGYNEYCDEGMKLPPGFSGRKLRSGRMPIINDEKATRRRKRKTCNSPVQELDQIQCDRDACDDEIESHKRSQPTPPDKHDSEKKRVRDGASIDSAICIDDSDSDSASHPSPTKRARLSPCSNLDLSPSNLMQTSSSAMNLVPPHATHAVQRTITTFYAHPMDFKYSRPTPSSPCTFCHDYRMGILGLPLRTIQVLIYPSDPLSYIELGGGHRADGHPSTKMCISCALDRLLMMRCSDHNPLVRLPESTKTVKTKDDYIRYVKDLMDVDTGSKYTHKKKKTATTSGRGHGRNFKPLFATCSLCPNPAEWQCGAFQAADKLMRPCHVPDHASDTLTYPSPSRTVAGTCSTTTTVAPGSDPTDFQQHTTAPDETTDSKPNMALPTPPPSQQLPSSSSSPSLHAVSQPTSSSTIGSSCVAPSAGARNLRPVLRSCGLLLCRDCKGLVTEKCRGRLDKKTIYAELAGRLGPRADLEFLFRGGLLDRAYRA